jgi:hypothetical protein
LGLALLLQRKRCLLVDPGAGITAEAKASFCSVKPFISQKEAFASAALPERANRMADRSS